MALLALVALGFGSLHRRVAVMVSFLSPVHVGRLSGVPWRVDFSGREAVVLPRYVVVVVDLGLLLEPLLLFGLPELVVDVSQVLLNIRSDKRSMESGDGMFEEFELFEVGDLEVLAPLHLSLDGQVVFMLELQHHYLFILELHFLILAHNGLDVLHVRLAVKGLYVNKSLLWLYFYKYNLLFA